jgi:hypothetical protein
MYGGRRRRLLSCSGLLRLEEAHAAILSLEPLHSVLLGEPVQEAHVTGLPPPVGYVHLRPAQRQVEVHAVDTDAGVVLETQVEVLLFAKTKVSVGGEVLLPQLVLLDLEATLKDLLSLNSPDGAMHPAIFSLRLMLKDFTVYRASENIGVLVRDSSILPALVSLSPDSLPHRCSSRAS